VGYVGVQTNTMMAKWKSLPPVVRQMLCLFAVAVSAALIRQPQSVIVAGVS
jgi:hypothetical protein